MEDMENLVLDGTENVDETATEETVVEPAAVEEPVPEKTYTQAELDDIVGKRLARREAKIRREYEKTYGELENVLKAGTGKEDVAEITDLYKQHYESKGVQIPKKPNYSDRDIEVLARAEADEIIKAGFEEVVEETDRLVALGVNNMSPREKEVFRTLAEYRKNAERGKELSKLGVSEDVYGSPEFKSFAAKFGADTSITEIYEIFNKMQPKKDIKPMGSMTNRQEPKTKDYYTQEEIERLTEEELDDPAVWEAVRRSMTGR